MQESGSETTGRPRQMRLMTCRVMDETVILSVARFLQLHFAWNLRRDSGRRAVTEKAENASVAHCGVYQIYQ